MTVKGSSNFLSSMLFKYKYTLFIISFFTSLCAFSQQKSDSRYLIEGQVIDSLLAEPVEMAAVALYNAKDSSYVHGTASGKDGKFRIGNVKPSAYYLSISFLGYKTTVMDVPVHRFSQEKINLGKINMPTSDIQLSSVVVTAEVPELIVKEDTLEYNAAAFRLTESAVVEDLLKRLPGMEVDMEGKITTTTGKEVKRVFVDGKEFFGNDPKMATRNLTADMVDKVQVVEKKSDLAILTGVEDDDPETIINITIKAGMKKGWMGNANGGVGELVDNVNNESVRYTTAVNINRFTDKDQVSFVANANNINQRASTDRGNSVRSGGNSAGGNGITSSNTFGVNLHGIINDKLKFGGSVSYNYSDNYMKTSTHRQTFFENDSTTIQNSSSQNRNFSNNASFNGRLEYAPNLATTMIFTPSISYNSSLSQSGPSETRTQNGRDLSLINSSNNFNTQNSNGFRTRMQLDISHKFSDLGRRLSFSGWFNLDNSKGKGTNNSENIFYRRPSANQSLDQQSTRSGNQNSYNMRLTYVEPLGKGNFLNFSYNLLVNNTNNRRKTLDYDSLTYDHSILNDIYSRSSDTRSVTQNIRANFNSNKTTYTYNAGVSFSPVYNKSKSFVKDWLGKGQDSIVNDYPGRNVLNFSPFVDFTYRFSTDRLMRKNIRLRYNGRFTNPTVEQLDPSENSTNLLNKTSGNPNLLPSFNNNTSLELNVNNRETQQSLTATVSHTFIRNQIINYTVYDIDGTGIRTTYPINENGSWNSSANILLSKPLDQKKKLRFSARTDVRYSNNIGYSVVGTQSLRNISKTVNFSETLTLSYANNWYYGQLRGSFRYVNTNYSLENLTPRKSYNYGVSYNTQITLPLSFTIASNINYNGNSGLSAGYNQSEILWNAELGKQFLKQNRGSLRLQITDILQQRLNIRRTQGNNYFQDSQSATLSSYAILSFSYRFNNVGGDRGRNRSRGSTNEGIGSENDSEIRGNFENNSGTRSRSGGGAGRRSSGGF